MNSHILIPRCVLKKFVNDKQYYFKYDIITDKITKAYPKTTNTAPDYFSPKMEKDLSKKNECPLTQLYKYYENFDFDCTESYLDEDTKIIALNYARSLITRNPSFFDFTKNNAIYLQFMSEQNQHDLVVDYSMDSRICGDLFQNIDVSFKRHRGRFCVLAHPCFWLALAHISPRLHSNTSYLPLSAHRTVPYANFLCYLKEFINLEYGNYNPFIAEIYNKEII